MVNVRRAQHLFFAFLGGGENVFFLIFCFSIGYEPQEKKKNAPLRLGTVLYPLTIEYVMAIRCREDNNRGITLPEKLITHATIEGGTFRLKHYLHDGAP